ncbi:MAG: DUF2232 domain-containing protein [Ndongobacter sp.]|nr:DUF2232 domain-containing protein [Ndongobacter sp.]
MNEMMEKYSGLLQAVAAAALGVALFYAQAQILAVFGLLLLTPYIVLWVSENARWAVLSYLLSGLGIFLLFGAAAALTTVPIIAGSSTCAAMLIERKRPMWETLLYPSFVGAGLFALVFVLLAWAQGMHLVAEIQQEVTNVVQTLLDQIRYAEDLTYYAKGMEQVTASALISRLMQIYPALLYGASLMMTAVNTLLARRVLAQMRPELGRAALADFCLPRKAGYVMAAVTVALFLAKSAQIPGGEILSMNSNIMCIAILLLNGIATFLAFLRPSVPPALRGLLVALILIFLDAWYIFVLFGGADIFLGLRSRTWRGKGV